MFELEVVWQWLVEKLGHAAASFVLGLLAGAGVVVSRFIWRQVRRAWCFFSSRARALRAVARDYTKDGPHEGRGLWLSKPITQPTNYENSIGKPVVLVVANHKGGVGKTTICGNLGAFWAREWQKNVLLIDLDSQGTLSAMALRAGNWLPPKGQDSAATRAVSGDLEPSIFVGLAKEVPQEPKLKCVPAYYDLAQADNRLIVEWLLKCKPRKKAYNLFFGDTFKRHDVRYNLADLLQSPAVRQEFHVVIIDCPPRFTTGSVQALCAGSHLLIPTILDLPSSEAVVAFVEEVERLRTGGVCPHINHVGIVGTMTSPNVDGIAERSAKALISDALRDRKITATALLDDSLFVQQATAFVNNSEEGIAYLVTTNNQRQQAARQAIARLSEYVAGQIGLPPPPAQQSASKRT